MQPQACAKLSGAFRLPQAAFAMLGAMLGPDFLPPSTQRPSMRVLIVEDDPLLAGGLADVLRREGYVADRVPSAEQAEVALRTESFDLIILDLGLPGADGVTWLKRLRAAGGQQAVLVVSAREAVADRVLGLEVGADDYLPKPFAIEELLARVSALARRGRAQRSHEISHGPLNLNLERKRATLQGRPLELTQREYAVLEYLLMNPDAILGKDRIAAAIASWDEDISPNAIEVHISRLRGKLEPAGITIRSVRGLGYFVVPHAAR
jgi:two-component system OmpR family response regulator